MKRSSIFLMTLTLIMLLCGSAYATEFEARGSAVMIGVRSKYNNSTTLAYTNAWVTNITGSDVDCRVRFYDHAGNDVTSYCSIYTGSESSASSQVVATGTGSFELPAGETRFLKLGVTSSNRNIEGYAVIEWSSADPLVRKPLMAIGGCYVQGGNRDTCMTLPVNGGQPF